MSPRREILQSADEAVVEAEGGARDIDPVAFEGDAALEVGMRPSAWRTSWASSCLREKLEIILEAARRRGQPVDHVLFAGPPGLGKTTLAGIMASEMGAGLRVTSGPALVRSGDVAAILTDLQPGDVLFIDEIHRMGRAVEELLYPAMEDFQLDIVLGRGPPPVPSGSTCRGSPSSAPRPGPVSSPGRFATALASWRASSSTAISSSSPSCTGRARCSGWR